MKKKNIISYLMRERDRYCDQRCDKDPRYCESCNNPAIDAYNEAIEAVEMRKE